MPSIQAVERLQGFPKNWTRAAETATRRSDRWKLVGNAVSVGVGKWIARRLLDPGDPVVESEKMLSVPRWPSAAYGHDGEIYRFYANAWPTKASPIHLAALLKTYGSTPLSERATRGFLDRVRASNLRTNPAFESALARHVDAEHRRSAKAKSRRRGHEKARA